MNGNKRLFICYFALIIFLAANMRASYTGIGTIIHLIKADLALSSAIAGMITTIPIIVFAIVCPLASMLSGRIGIGPMLEIGLVFICAGSGLRGFFGAAGLFTGSVILAIGVGIMNALMVGLIKLRFTSHTGLVTSAYTTTMALSTAIFMGLNIHICNAITWRGCLSMWAIPAAAAIIIWGTQAFKKENHGAANKPKEKGLMLKLFKNPRAWFLMVFMGTQSMMFYCISAWIPSILVEKGMDEVSAASATTILQLVSLITTLLVPILCEKMNKRTLAVALQGVYIIGGIIFYFADLGPICWLAIVLLALGMGSGFSFCIYMFSAKTSSASQTAALSGFSQCGGYVMAAIGPVLMGAIYDMTESWNMAMIFCFIIIIIMTAAAYLSTDDELILD